LHVAVIVLKSNTSSGPRLSGVSHLVQVFGMLILMLLSFALHRLPFSKRLLAVAHLRRTFTIAHD
jgi:hypothetical protein